MFICIFGALFQNQVTNTTFYTVPLSLDRFIWPKQTLLLALVVLAFTSFGQTYHNLANGSFTQDWSNISLITANDNWGGVPSIIGYRGDNITSAIGVDPQTLVGEGTVTIDVNANQTNPNTNTTGGVTEFEIGNPVIALQGSSTADAPNLILYINTLGVSNLSIQYTLRDIDGSADNAVQAVALQYRIGTSGNFTNLAAGFVADASSGPSLATLETQVNVSLPATLDNQSQLQLRIITSNADGSDEWIGVDNIVVSGYSGPTLLLSQNSLSGFTYEFGSGPSPSQSSSLSGTALTPSSGIITITGTASYEVSTDNLAFSNSVTIPYISGALSTTSFWVRLKAALAIGTYTENISISGGGAMVQYLYCTGTVSTPPPQLFAGSLNPFGNVVVNTSSEVQSYMVSGLYLTSNLLITPPAGFEVSLNEQSGFVSHPNNLSISPTMGIIANTSIYVKFSPSLAVQYTGFIQHTSTSAQTQNVGVSGLGILPMPTGNVVNLVATTTGPTTIPVAWVDASGSIPPENYLIKGSTIGYEAISDPIDGIMEPNAPLVLNIGQNIETCTFTGLSNNTTYYFKVFPYTNTGAFVNYKIPTVPLQDRATTFSQPAITYVWNKTGTASWIEPTNWTPSRQNPQTNDILVFDNGFIITVTNVPQQSIGQLHVLNSTQLSLQADAWNSLLIQGGTGSDMVISSGSSLNINGTNVFTIALGSLATGSIDGQIHFSVAGHKLTANTAGSLVFNAGSQFFAEDGFSGNPFGTTATGSVVFASNSTYIHQSGSNPFSSANVVVFQTGSLYKLTSDITPSFSGRTYANVEIDAPSSTITATGSSAVIIDNLTLTAGTLNFNVTGNPGHAIKGSIGVSAGASLNFSPLTAGTIHLNGTQTQSIGGGGTIQFNTNSTLDINNNAGISLLSDLSVNGNLSITNGVFDLNNHLLTLGTAAQVTGSFSAANMIAADGTGELRKMVNSTSSFTFPIGDLQNGSDYSPVLINLLSASTTSGSWIGLNVNNNGSFAQGSSYLNRYWEVTSSGISNVMYSINLTYPLSDVVGLENDLLCTQISPTDTNYFDFANTTQHTLSATGLSTFGIFTAWEPQIAKTLQLSLFLEGLYDGGGIMHKAQDENGQHFTGQIADLIQVELRNANSPYSLAFSYTIELLVNGQAAVTVPAALNGNYYIVIKHRNSIETWSSLPLSFSNSTLMYDFSNDDGKAYGNNLKFMQDSWVLYGGDVNQDGFITIADVEQADVSSNNFSAGFLVDDTNGDGVIDALDMLLIDNNAALGIEKKTP